MAKKNEAQARRSLQQKALSSRYNKNNRERKVVRRNDVRERPLKAVRHTNSSNPQILLDTPNVSTKLAIEYPTPSWFRPKDVADVSVIVPMFKSQSVLKELLDSWDLDNDGLKVEVIFVDDNCPNNSKDLVVKLWSVKNQGKPIGRVFYSPMNMGFATTCNIGANKASGEYLIFLNADTVVTPHWIKPMIRLLRDSSVGIVGNLQIKKDGVWNGTIDSAGSEWSWHDMAFLHIGRHSYNNQKISKPFSLDNCPQDLFEVGDREMVTGCCLAMRKDLFKEVGGFNQNYRIGYWEDTDLCMTVREKGYRVVYQPNSKIYHYSGHSSGGSPHRFHTYNRNYFANKWINSGRLDPLVKSKRDHIPDVKSILLRRQAAHGDVLMAAAVVPALKKRYPGCKVMFATDCKEILSNNPFIDRVMDDLRTSERQFSVYYNLDFVYENRPFTNILDAYAEAVGVNRTDCELFLDTSPVANLPQQYVAIHAGKTLWAGRDWSSLKFEAISTRLRQRGLSVVCVGTSSDNKVSSDLDLRGKTNVRQLAHVIKNAKLFVGIDSFPMHVAQTFGTPGVCFFGSVDPKLRIIRDNMVGLVAEGLGCLGCHHRKPTPCTVTSTCEIGTSDCINQVSIDMMWRKIESFL